MNNKQNLLLVLLVITGALLWLRETYPNKKADQRHPSTTGSHSGQSLNSKDSDPTMRSPLSANSQAEQLQAKLTLAVDRFRDLPFHPEYGEQVFDETKALNESDREKWKRHCRLRDTYKSDRIRELAFLEIHELVNQFGLDDDMDKLSYLNDIAYGLSISVQHATDYSPELISDARQKELKEFLNESITRYEEILANIFGQEMEQGFMDALMEIHPKGGIGDPSTHIEPGERIIIN